MIRMFVDTVGNSHLLSTACMTVMLFNLKTLISQINISTSLLLLLI